jgi:GTP-binding protein YchF
MKLSVGIIGLPNVGKSTLFNALLKKQQALVANYPFATIEPNVGVVPVLDQRLLKLAEITKQEYKMDSLPPIKQATVEFVDIAGLVKGASEGAGLGNKFLSHIREVSVIAHVVRAFEDENILKEGAVDPKSDYDTIRTELLLADLESARNQEAKIKSNDPLKMILAKIIENLNKGISINNISFHEEEKEIVGKMFFLTAKPEIVVLNVSENDYNPVSVEKMVNLYAGLLGIEDHKIIVICAKIEADLASLAENEQIEYLKDLGFETSGLKRLIKKAYEELGLISFLTAGEKEVRAWTIKKGSTAIEASGEIHTDFMKKFIKAEVVSYNDFVENGGWKNSREHGKTRFEGRDYVVNDGDVIEFKIGT